MEENGWLDQILVGVLGFLNQPWLAITIAIGGGFAVAYLARKSPKNDWEFIQEWPSGVLTGAFVVLACAKSAPRLVLPTTRYSCDRVPGPLGIPVTANCHWITDGTLHTVQDYTMADLLRDFFASLVQDAVFTAVGASAGIVVAVMVLRRRP